MFQRPYNVEEIRKNYPDKADYLLHDPVHRWRAETGIELIHEEPNMAEQERIWKNWQEMTPEMKRKSDQKSVEFFGLNNFNYHQAIMKRKYHV